MSLTDESSTNPSAKAFAPREASLTKQRPHIVAVDGPAGSGKSSICQTVCDQVGWTYINTGALYRAVGLLALDRGVSMDDPAAIVAVVNGVASDLRWDSGSRELWCGDTNVTLRLGSEQAGYAASKVAKLGMVREALLPVQRQLTLAAPRGALVDGRDIGTVVFPNADLKIFLTASLEARSRRRQAQLAGPSELDEIKRGIDKRDQRDSAREVAPLRQADDAVVLDTSDMTVVETIAAVVQLLRSRGLVL